MVNKKEMKERVKKSNKGFSLVELIVVIAIMAILVGVVGTQVLPYIEKSREAKDEQVISSICTASLTAFSQNASSLDNTKKYGVNDFIGSATATSNGVTADTAAPTSVTDDLKELCKYSTITNVISDLESKKGKSLTHIQIVYDASSGDLSVSALDNSSHLIVPVITAR